MREPRTTALAVALRADLDTLPPKGRVRVRNALLVVMRQKGWTLKESGEMFGIDKSVVSRILGPKKDRDYAW